MTKKKLSLKRRLAQSPEKSDTPKIEKLDIPNPATNGAVVEITPPEKRVALVPDDIYDANPLERIERVFNLQRKISGEKVQSTFSYYQTMSIGEIETLTAKPNYEKNLSVMESDVIELISLSKDKTLELKDRMGIMKYRHERAWGKTIEKREISGIDGDSVKIDVFDAQKTVENLTDDEIKKLIAMASR